VLTLGDLVSNNSISADGAAVLRTIGAAGRPFVVYAGPRNAGKSTLVEAILAEAPAELPRQEFFGTEAEVQSLSAAPAGGYLTVAEIGHRGRPGYLAGEEVPRVFGLLRNGYALASSLHAESVDGVYDVLRANGIAATTVTETVEYLIKVRALGDSLAPSTRRIVEQIHQISPGDGAEPRSTLLYRTDVLSSGTLSS
jgi:type IV secretory pathway ATPase VirB11/archaellum biosynthesis ATPase